MSQYLLNKYLSCFSKYNKLTLSKAGPRYTTMSEPGSPNVPIDDLLKQFALAQKNNEFYTNLKKYTEDLKRKRFLHLHFPTKNAETLRLEEVARSINRTVDKIIYHLELFINTRNVAKNFNIHFLSKLCSESYENLNKLEDDYEKISKVKSDGSIIPESEYSQIRDISSSDYSISTLQRNLSSLHYYLKDGETKLINNPYILLIGKAGIGKTHFLCDIAFNLILQKVPVVVTLASDFKIVKDPLVQLIENLGLTISKDKFLSQLNTLGTLRNQRCLIMFDAINESDKEGWKKNVNKLIQDIRQYKNVGLILSCRYPFNHYMIPKSSKLITLSHPGFSGQEVLAQNMFFEFYGLPQPEIPLLTEEFSNPLFLKLMCKSLKELGKGKHPEVKDIAAGQVGMLKILEDYIKKVSKRSVEKDYGLKIGYVWSKYKDFAKEMGKRKQEYLETETVYSTLDHPKSKKIVDDLLSEGLLLESMEYNSESKKFVSTIKFPYQKFSDHLIARYIFDYYISGKSDEEIKQLLEKDSLKELLFRKSEYGGYDFNLIEALIVEFPTRIKKEVELLDYLDKSDVKDYVITAFLHSLAFRDVSTLNKSTHKWINIFLLNDYYRNETLNSIVTMATKAGHKYNVDLLDKYLRKQKLPKRDILWSEFIRKQFTGDVIFRILDWFEKNNKVSISSEQARIYILILMWTQSTTNRNIRDRASRSIFNIGLNHPEELLEITINSLNINDPYIVERMIGVSYGVILSTIMKDENKNFLVDYASKLLKKFFAANAKFYTTHIMMRDYARMSLTVIENKYSVFKPISKKKFQSPFKKREKLNITFGPKHVEESTENLHLHLEIDFMNYTVGSMFEDRNNYDNKHPEYVKAVKTMHARIFGLGYSAKEFESIYSEISQSKGSNEINGKSLIETYLQKYAWISYYEIYGNLKDGKLIKKDYINHPRYYTVDIDPTFPSEVKTEKVVSNNFLGIKSQKNDAWLKSFPSVITKSLKKDEVLGEQGVWVLLEGYITQECKIKGRKISLFVNTRFVENKDMKKISYKMTSNNIFSFNDIFRSDTEAHMIYSGEIPSTDVYPLLKFRKEKVNYFETTVKKVKSFKLLKNNEELNNEDFRNVITHARTLESNEKIEKYFKENDFVIKPYYQRLESKKDKSLFIKTLSPTFSVYWGDYTSPILSLGSVPYLTKDICTILDLGTDRFSPDLFDKNGRKASLYVRNEVNYQVEQSFLYIREDVVDEYMKIRNCSILMSVWGHKDIVRKKNDDYGLKKPSSNKWQDFKRIIKYK